MMLDEPPVWPARQRLQDKLAQRLQEREEELRKADELVAAKAAEDGDKKKKKKKKKKDADADAEAEAEAEADADESRRVAERETRQSAFYWQ